MPIQVAQLSIMVTAETTAAVTGLGQVQQAYAMAAQAANLGANSSAQSEEKLLAAIQQVSQAQRLQTDVIEDGLAKLQAGAGQVAQKIQPATRQVGSLGTAAANSLYQMNSAMILSGQNVGPLSSGLIILASSLQMVDRNASLASKTLNLLGTASLIAGGLILNFAGHVEQSRNMLKQALETEGRDITEWQGTINRAIAQGEKWGHNQSQVMDSLQTLSRIVKDQNQLTEAYAIAEDVAAARGLKLSQATDLVTRAMAGNSRALRALGITETLIADPAKKYAAAQDALTKATEAHANAAANVRDAEQRYQTQLEASANAVDQVAQAEQQLDRTRERVAQQQADAEQRLADIRAIQAAQREKRQQDAKVDTAAQEKLAEAAEKVLAAQQRLATAQGGGIADAQKQLRAAIDQQRAALDKQVEAQQNAARGGTEEERLRRQFELRDAIQAVDRAQKAGQRDIEDAEKRVIQATKDRYVATLRLRDAHLAVDHARRTEASAALAENEAQKRADAAKLAMETQQQHVLDLLKGKVDGLADAHAGGNLGKIRAFFAEWENHISNVGGGLGKALITVGLITSGLGQMSRALGGLGAGKAATEIGALSGELGAGEAAGGLGLAGALGEAGLALVAFGASYAGTMWLLHHTPLGDWVMNGANQIKGWVDGITSGAKDVWHAMTHVGSTVQDQFQQQWEMRSPSGWMRRHGALIMEGLALGISDNSHRPISQISRAVAGMQSATTARWATNAGQGYNGSTAHGASVHIDVHGSVVTEKQLIRVVRDGLVEMGVNQGGVTI